MDDYEFTATYSPEDNKLRLYALVRFDDETKERIKSAGYRWAGKQELYAAPRWTIKAEDMALELAGQIDDEDTSLADRSADRADRFGGYRDKRRSEAHGFANTYEAGPDAYGHQSQRRPACDRQISHFEAAIISRFGPPSAHQPVWVFCTQIAPSLVIGYNALERCINGSQQTQKASV